MAHNLCVLIGQIACQSSSLRTVNYSDGSWGDEKRKLFEVIKQYNEQVPEEQGINEEMVERRLSEVGHASGEDSLIWP